MKITLTILSVVILSALYGFAPDWVTVQNNQGRFRAKFPDKPVIDIDTTHKTPWYSVMYNSMQATEDNSIYGVLYADYPASEANSDAGGKKVDEFLDHALEKSVTGVNGHVEKQEAITFKGYPARQIRVIFAHGKAVMDLRIFLVHSRCYILEVGYQLKKEGNPSIARFFDSFELI